MGEKDTSKGKVRIEIQQTTFRRLTTDATSTRRTGNLIWEQD
jgi:hypothetical protein